MWSSTCIVAQRKLIQLGTVKLWVRSLASLSGLRIWHCHELGCRLQIWLGSCVAVAVVWAGSCSSDSTPYLGTSICRRCSPKKAKRHTHKKIPTTKAWPSGITTEFPRWSLCFSLSLFHTPHHTSHIPVTSYIKLLYSGPLFPCPNHSCARH